MKKRVSLLILLVLLGFSLTVHGCSKATKITLKKNIKPKKVNITNEINNVLTKRKTKEKLGLANKYSRRSGFRFDMPNKMDRVAIVETPLFFKNNVEDYNAILNFLVKHMDERVNYINNLKVTVQKSKKLKHNYAELKKCSQIHHERYNEEFKHINTSYINKLSIDEQDKLYLESNARSQLFKQLLAGCMTYFNKAIDNYNELTKYYDNSELIIPDITQKKFPKLVQGLINSKSMNNKERNYWFQVLPKMTNEQVNELQDIIDTEKRKLDEIERKYSSNPN